MYPFKLKDLTKMDSVGCAKKPQEIVSEIYNIGLYVFLPILALMLQSRLMELDGDSSSNLMCR